MLSLKYLTPFTYYNIFLVFLFSLSVTALDSLKIANSISYVLFHYVIIYLGLYYYRKTLYIIFFLYGIGIDLFLIDQIGPHLLTFLILLILFSKTKKIFSNLNSKKIYSIIIVIQVLTIFIEMMVTSIFFEYYFDLYLYIKLFFISLLLSYPILFIFSKIDILK